jgi:hypothetical protein
LRCRGCFLSILLPPSFITAVTLVRRSESRTLLHLHDTNTITVLVAFDPAPSLSYWTESLGLWSLLFGSIPPAVPAPAFVVASSPLAAQHRSDCLTTSMNPYNCLSASGKALLLTCHRVRLLTPIAQRDALSSCLILNMDTETPAQTEVPVKVTQPEDNAPPSLAEPASGPAAEMSGALPAEHPTEPKPAEPQGK